MFVMPRGQPRFCASSRHTAPVFGRLDVERSHSPAFIVCAAMVGQTRFSLVERNLRSLGCDVADDDRCDSAHLEGRAAAKLNTELRGPRNGSVSVAAATTSVVHNSKRLGLLRKADQCVRNTSTTANSVSSETINQNV